MRWKMAKAIFHDKAVNGLVVQTSMTLVEIAQQD
jgi:hypothetical protein